MEQYDLTPEETKALYDVSRVMRLNETKLDAMHCAYKSIKVQGAASDIDIAQLVEVVPPIYTMLAEIKGVSPSEVYHSLKQELIPYEDVKQAFLNMTSEGGIYYNPKK